MKLNLKKIFSPLLCVFALSAFGQTTNNPGIPQFGSGGTSSGLIDVTVNGSGTITYPPNFFTQNIGGFVAAHSGVANTVYLSTNGNDGTAQLGRSEYPAQTFWKANALAYPFSGTVVVEPGTFFTNNILTNGVNYYFMPGAVVSYAQPSTNDAGFGIIDDRACGATTNILAGAGVFNFVTYTGRVFTASQGEQSNPHFQGVVVVSNSLTRIHIDGDSINFSSYHQGGWNGAIVDEGAGELVVKLKTVVDPFRGQLLPVFTNIVAHNNPTYSSQANGVVWVSGYADITIGSNAPGQYGIWGENAVGVGEGCTAITATSPTDLYYYGNFLANKIYMDNSGGTQTNTPEWRTWIYINSLYQDPVGVAGGGAASYLGAGKHYLFADKIVSTDGDCIDTEPGTNDTLLVSLKAQVLAVTNIAGPWVRCVGGTLTVDCQRTEDLSAMVTNGIETLTNSGNGSAMGHLYFSAQQPVKVGNGTAVYHGAGEMRLKDCVFDTSAVNAVGNNPIIVASPNLVLQSCATVAPALASNIWASSSQTVTVLNGIATNGLFNNITVSTVAK